MGDVFDALCRSQGKPVPPKPSDGEVEGMLDGGPPLPGAGAARAERAGALPIDEAQRASEVQARLASGVVPPDPLSAPPRPQPAPPPPEAAARVVANGHAHPHPQPASHVIAPPRLAPANNGNGSHGRAHAPASAAELARQALIAEQYRLVRDGILKRRQERSATVHLLTSATAQDGRTQTLAALAQSFAELPGHRVVIVEADLRSPTLHRFFQRSFTPGLLHFLRNRASLDQSVHHTRYETLDVLPAGDCEFVEATQLVSSQRMVEAVVELRQRYDTVLIDAPPAPAHEDAGVLGGLADECLIVARTQRTPGDLIESAKARMRASGCRIAGLILSHG